MTRLLFGIARLLAHQDQPGVVWAFAEHRPTAQLVKVAPLAVVNGLLQLGQRQHAGRNELRRIGFARHEEL